MLATFLGDCDSVLRGRDKHLLLCVDEHEYFDRNLGWSKGLDIRYRMISAHAEAVSSKPACRNAFKDCRCLIPTEEIYEWKGEKGGKMPFLIRLEDSEP